MSIKTDEKKENIQKIKKNIENTYNNMEFANDIIDSVSDYETKLELNKKNIRRMDEIRSMTDDIKGKVNEEYNRSKP